jgi:putative flippase GtrA
MRFLIGGAANTAVTYALFVGLSLLIPSPAAYTLSYVAGVGLSYLINTLLVFRVQVALRSALQFPVIYVIQYIVGLMLLTFLTSIGIDSRIAILCVIAFNIPLTFVLTKLVFRTAARRTSKS